MDFKQLQKMGAFVSPELIKEPIEFTRPRTPEEGEGEPITEKADLYIRKRSSRDFLDINRTEGSDKAFLALHRGVCNPDGSPLFPSIEDAACLAEWLLGPILNAVNKVNSFTPKRSAARTASGTTSPSRSGAGASRNGRTPSRKKSGPTG